MEIKSSQANALYVTSKGIMLSIVITIKATRIKRGTPLMPMLVKWKTIPMILMRCIYLLFFLKSSWKGIRDHHGWTLGLLAIYVLTRICYSTYQHQNHDEEQLFRGDFSTSIVKWKGMVTLKMSFGKVVITNIMLHDYDIHKIFVSGYLVKNGFKLVFQFDKFVLSKRNMYVDKCYLS